MIVSSALLCGCQTLYSEDMQNGQRIDDRLMIDGNQAVITFGPDIQIACAAKALP
ncbi:MAG: hypothetical protein LBV49_07935 [Azonexus sp.]|jgi:hypothetical protein|nr:hypothetical protein [Azonexus sp.]